jgi:glycopeptide antibiotics resistance protein
MPLAATGYLCVVAYVVLWPTAGVPSESVTVLSRLLGKLGAEQGRTTRAIVEFVSNVLIAVPAPVLLRGWFSRWDWRHWIAVGLATSSSIELYQLVVVPDGRSATVRDVVANTLGVALGCLVAAAARRVGNGWGWAPMMRPDDRRQQRGG